MKKEAASDGVDRYGFPFTFYDHFEGKCSNCYVQFGFKLNFLLVDALFALAFGLSVALLKRKFDNSKKTKK